VEKTFDLSEEFDRFLRDRLEELLTNEKKAVIMASGVIAFHQPTEDQSRCREDLRPYPCPTVTTARTFFSK